ncbi:MAG: hypothetical protein P8Y60_20895, partial [Calditrichota bacterium]
RKQDIFNQLHTFGFYHMVIGKLLGKTGIRNLSQSYVSKRIDLNRLVDELYQQRSGYYKAINKELVIEAYSGWYGVIPGIKKLFDHYKIAIIIRDPRTWVTSYMNFGTKYGKRDWVNKLGYQRLNPRMAGEEKYIQSWNYMDTFQRLCWLWQAVYEIMIRDGIGDIYCQIFRYEDLFLSPSKRETFRDFLRFITTFPNRAYEWQPLNGILDQKINNSKHDEFPNWKKWGADRAQFLRSMCGHLMQQYGYGMEEEWKNLVNNSSE